MISPTRLLPTAPGEELNQGGVQTRQERPYGRAELRLGSRTEAVDATRLQDWSQ